MGNNNQIQNEDINKNNIESKVIEKNPKRKNDIDKKKYKDINIDEQKKQFANNALKKNNEYRKKHGVAPLDLDDYLNKRAFILAKLFVNEEEFDNDNLLYKNREDLGMNILMSENKLDAENLMNKWYEENINYNFIEPKELECNNFTQMIWKDSKKFGIGYCHLGGNENNQFNEKKSLKKFCYIALYYPEGNKPGEYIKNVLKIQKEINKSKNEEIANKSKINSNFNKKEKDSRENKDLEYLWDLK